MKKLSTYLLLILFSFSAPSFADDIRDFQIEGISIGDSALDYFTEEEIDIALLCLNTWGFKELRYTRPVLKKLDPLYIKECLIHGYNSELFSTQSKKTIFKVIDSLEEIAIAVH